MKKANLFFFGILVLSVLLFGLCIEKVKIDDLTCIGEGKGGGGGAVINPESFECCPGLKKIAGNMGVDAEGVCRQALDGGFVCAKCGEGKCGIGENKCNCPSDCSAACAEEGEGVFDIPGMGPVKCCDVDAGIKPSTRIDTTYNICSDPDRSGSKGICSKSWAKTCGNGVCDSGEDKCNCPQDCKGEGGQECVDSSDCVVAVDLGGCCACPRVLPRTTLDGIRLVVYESGKDYSRMLPDECRNAVCSPCGPVSRAICQSGKCVNAPVCGNIYCERGEDPKTCPQDCGTGAVCGNGFCEAGENRTSCGQDCIEKRIVCGDNYCTIGENESNCPVDCGPHRPVCGNGFCEKPSGENATNCVPDCKINSVCGNLACEEDEDKTTCPQDCADHT